MARTTLEGQVPLKPTRRDPPGPRGHFLFGVLREYAKEPATYALWQAREFGEVSRARFGPNHLYFINSPAGVKHILQDNQRNYGRNQFANDILKLFVGESLLTTEGDYWLRQRRLMQPMFHRQRIASFGRLMTEKTEEMLGEWEQAAAGGRVLDVAEEMMRLTLKIVGLALFSADLSDETSQFGQAVKVGRDYFDYRNGTLFPLPLWVPTRRNRSFRAGMARTDAIVYDIIRERRRTGEDAGDLLSMLMEVRDEETGEGMTDLQLRNEVMTMLMAGHDTTSNTLSWTFYLLSRHPQVVEKLRAELAQVLNGRAPGIEDLHSLPYTKMVIEEAMRLYPPAWVMGRQSIEADEIGGYTIPAGASLAFYPYVIHRHPDHWEEPERFDPERFTSERSQGRAKYAYFPFGGGPHLCIGNVFALTEAQLILATVAQRSDLTLVPGHPVELEPLITLRPKHGLKMTLNPVR